MKTIIELPFLYNFFENKSKQKFTLIVSLLSLLKTKLEIVLFVALLINIKKPDDLNNL
jgi:hypothetical protein